MAQVQKGNFAHQLARRPRISETLGGYHTLGRGEAKMRCLKAVGKRIAARDPDRQTAKIHFRIALTNLVIALGDAEILRVA